MLLGFEEMQRRPIPVEISVMQTRLAIIAAAIYFLTFSAFAGDTTGVTGTAIKIGLFGPMTGQSNLGAKPVYGAAAIYKDVNAKGGIYGRKIEIVIEDDGCDGNKGIAAVKKLIAQDKVFLLH